VFDFIDVPVKDFTENFFFNFYH